MPERSASRVLASEANGATLHEQGTHGQSLGHSPVNRVVGDHLLATLQLRCQTRMHVEIVRQRDL